MRAVFTAKANYSAQRSRNLSDAAMQIHISESGGSLIMAKWKKISKMSYLPQGYLEFFVSPQDTWNIGFFIISRSYRVEKLRGEIRWIELEESLESHAKRVMMANFVMSGSACMWLCHSSV